MRFDIITIFPEFFGGPLDYGIVRRARESRLIEACIHDLRDFAHDRHRTVDDRPFGGGEGMVMKPEPLFEAVETLVFGGYEKGKTPAPEGTAIVLLSAAGKFFRQDTARRFAGLKRIVLLCGRYEGVDERLVHRAVDEELSIGDYVLSGGELAAMVLIDAVVRQLPGALGDGLSAEQDSFVNGLLDCPHYTRPERYEGEPVPAVLLSGHHAEIERWRLKQSLGRTWLRRPELLERRGMSETERKLLEEFKQEQNEEGAKR